MRHDATLKAALEKELRRFKKSLGTASAPINLTQRGWLSNHKKAFISMSCTTEKRIFFYDESNAKSA